MVALCLIEGDCANILTILLNVGVDIHTTQPNSALHSRSNFVVHVPSPTGQSLRASSTVVPG
jgi:hypothetical protein